MDDDPALQMWLMELFIPLELLTFIIKLLEKNEYMVVIYSFLLNVSQCFTEWIAPLWILQIWNGNEEISLSFSMVMLEVTFYNSTFHTEFMYTSSLSLVPPKKNLEDTLLILIPE